MDDIPGGLTPSRFASRLWAAWGDLGKTVPGGAKQQQAGRIFELLVAETLAQNDILPFYEQGVFALVPNAIFDFVCYRPKSPVVLSAKSSLRERYKQADLEGMALKQVYRRASCYLLTADKKEAGNVNAKIEKGDIAGLNKCVVVSEPEFNALIAKLAKMKFCEQEPIDPLSSGKLVAKATPARKTC